MTVRAYSVANNPVVYQNSGEVDEFFDSADLLFAGQVSGSFKDGHRMGETPDERNSGSTHSQYQTSATVSYEDDGNAAIFNWGKPAAQQSPNTLRFQGSTIINVEPEQLFRVGQLNYFNGSIYSGTEAHAVTLNLQLDMTIPDRTEEFEVALALENTPNGSDVDQSADSVRLQSRSFQLAPLDDGTQFYLVIEFGPVSENGFSTIDEFHVHENTSAMASIYGYFTENPPPGLESHASTHESEEEEEEETEHCLPTLTANNASAIEGDDLSFTFTLNAPRAVDTVIEFSTEDGTATAGGNDYIAQVDQSITIPAGQISRDVTVLTVGDNTVELNESMQLVFSTLDSKVSTGGGMASGTIENDDYATLTVLSSIGAEGGPLLFVATLSNPCEVPVKVTFSTQDGTAVAAEGDYVAATDQEIWFPTGVLVGVFTVQTKADGLVEGTEFFHIDYSFDPLSPITRLITSQDSSARGTILSLDTATLSVSNPTAAEGSDLEFVAKLSRPVDVDTHVSYSTMNGTATVADEDYDPKINWMLTIPAGQTEASIWVSTTEDNSSELSETVLLKFKLQESSRPVVPVGLMAIGTINNGGGGGGILAGLLPH